MKPYALALLYQADLIVLILGIGTVVVIGASIVPEPRALSAFADPRCDPFGAQPQAASCQHHIANAGGNQ